jgi:hypothetical protein
MTAVAGTRRAGDLILRTAARGAALIGAAVVLGILLLQVIDNGGTPGSSSGTTPANTSSGTSTTTQKGGGRAPSQILVQVLNGSGVNAAAQTKSNELRAKGYKIAPPGNAAARTGNAVQCKSGFEKEADALAVALGTGTTTEPFPNPAPTGTPTDVNCLVVLGKTG